MPHLIMKILHISDIHCNEGTDFNKKMFAKGLDLVNSEEDVSFVFISGDLTTNGLLSEYQMAKENVGDITHRCIIVPGNHDERNLGYKLFPEFFGEGSFIHTIDDVSFVGLASSEPDKDDGRLGRARHKLIEESVKDAEKLTIVGFHHHLIPVPNSGREKNIIEDAGETLDIILKNQIPLVLMGHRHVPYGVKLHNTILVNAGTLSCTRTRAHFGNTFNTITIDNSSIRVHVTEIPSGKKRLMLEFDINNGSCTNNLYEC
jgi:3',5'-cyclic-AMP phosphodiesterase